MLRQLQSENRRLEAQRPVQMSGRARPPSESRWEVGWDTPETTRTSLLRLYPWICPGKAHCSPPQELLLAFMWQGSSSHLWVSLKVLTDIKEESSTLAHPISAFVPPLSASQAVRRLQPCPVFGPHI